MDIDKLSDLNTTNQEDEAMQHLEGSHEALQGKLAGNENVLNSYDELHTLNATGMGTELDGSTQAVTEAQDVSLHADGAGAEHLGGLPGGEEGTIAADLHFIDLSGA